MGCGKVQSRNPIVKHKRKQILDLAVEIQILFEIKLRYVAGILKAKFSVMFMNSQLFYSASCFGLSFSIQIVNHEPLFFIQTYNHSIFAKTSMI